MRDINRSILLNLIRTHQPVSRADLAVLTGMYRSTISDIVKELLEAGLLVEELGKPEGRGRVPVLLSLNDRGFEVIAVSVRPEQTDVALAGLTGKLGKTISFPTPAHPKQMLAQLERAIRRLKRAGGRPRTIHQIGVSMPGLVDSDSGRILLSSHLPGYAGYNLAAGVTERTGIETAVGNDAKLGALAELSSETSGQEAARDFVFLEIGMEGVGGGVVTNGELRRGSHATLAPEFGHMVVQANGPMCGCGRRGCWELYVSDRATVLRWSPSADPRDPQIHEQFWKAVSKGEPQAIRSLRETARFLGIGLGNIVCTLDPVAIVIAGRVCGAWDLVLPILQKALPPAGVEIPLRRARLNSDELCLQGAILLGLSRAFRQPSLGIGAAVAQ
jgi:predicted NBD/HSP70 family sugar kinase/biotin operon repressor